MELTMNMAAGKAMGGDAAAEAADSDKKLTLLDAEIGLIIFFAPKDGAALYSQQKQDWELTVAQIMNSLLPKASALVLLIFRVDFLND